VGEPDTQPIPGGERQFYWLWAPLNFEDRVTLFHRNDDGDGRPWTRYAAMVPLDERCDAASALRDSDGLRVFAEPRSTVILRPGTRHAAAATLELGGPLVRDGGAAAGAARDGGGVAHGDRRPSDRAVTIELEPQYEFYMSGIGYGHPQWGHGRNRGELAVGFDAERLADADSTDPLHLHVQALCDARLVLPDGVERKGQGVLEQLILGRHAPSGLDG
jgi:hypothetical protein